MPPETGSSFPKGRTSVNKKATEHIHDFAAPGADQRGADDEVVERVRGQTRNPRATGDLSADVRDEQKKGERQGRARFGRSTRGHAMKKRNHQAQREQTRPP